MKKYDIVRFFAAADAKKFRPGDAVIGGNKEWVTDFDTKSGALKALDSWCQNRYELCHCSLGVFFAAEEFAVEENEYTDGGELVSSTLLATADTSEFDVAFNRYWLDKNKFTLKIANFDGTNFGEWMPVEEESEDWFDDVEDFLRTLRRNGFFAEDVADAATRDSHRYKVVATYNCRDANEDFPMTWSELAELAGKEDEK